MWKDEEGDGPINKADKDIENLTNKFKELEDIMVMFADGYKGAKKEEKKAKRRKRKYCKREL